VSSANNGPLSHADGAWLNRLPNRWDVVRLKFAVRVRSVKRNVVPKDRYIGLEHVESWTGRLQNSEDASANAEGLGVVFEAGDVLFGKLRPYLAKVFLADRPGIASTEFLALQGVRVEAGFLRYCFVSEPFIGAVVAATYGAKMPRANWEDIGNLPQVVPPRQEQRAIADFLDRETAKIDALIAAQERLIALLDEKRQATITHAVTKGLDPNAPMKESGVEWLGKVPRHWGVIPLKRCCRIPNGLVDPTVGRYATLSLIAPNHVQSGTGRLLEVETADDQGAISGKYHFAEGTVLYSKIRPALRKACVAPFEGLCSADMYPIYSTKITPRLLLYQLLSDYFSSFAILSSDRVAMPKVNRETIGDFPMVVPPSAEQEVIVRYVDEAVAEIDRLGDRSVEVIERLRERRTALITAAVTGQIDVTRQAITETAK
jgi:type I restriction enzyme S subunit